MGNYLYVVSEKINFVCVVFLLRVGEQMRCV